MMMTSKYLNVIKTKEAIESAKEKIAEERSGEQYGLLCRWNRINVAMLKYFRFSQSTMIGGRSGSGKSYVLNLIRNDFLDYEDVYYHKDTKIFLGNNAYIGNGMYHNANCFTYQEWLDTYGTAPNMEQDDLYFPEARIVLKSDGTMVRRGINRGCKYDVVVIHCGFEMNAEDELLRTASNILGTSYGYILSAEYNKKQYGGYNKLSDTEQDSVNYILDNMGNRKEYYIPNAGNVKQIINTVDIIANRNPNSKIVVSIDHTLLTKKLNEKGQGELITSMAFLAVDLRKLYGAMVIYTHQLNNLIESDDRVSRSNLHYPTKKDLHYGSEIWWAMDNVMIFHRPELLNIAEYSPNKLDTKNMLHCASIKSRMGRTGNIWLIEDFKHGRIHNADRAFFQTKSS